VTPLLDRKEIDIEIARLEYGESSYPAYAKLANLYTIRDRMDREVHPAPYEVSYSAAPAALEDSSVVGEYGDSDFLRAVSGVDQHDAWAIMDDLMDTLHTVNPRVYEGVMRKIRAL
jgi:hypothetical protein